MAVLVRFVSFWVIVSVTVLGVGPNVIGAGRAWAMDGSLSMDVSPSWLREWPDTDFSQRSILFSEIFSGGPPRDGIPSIDAPKFVNVDTVTDLTKTEPVIVLTLGGETKLYPLRILIWHEIVNDVIANQPVVVTYCPLCNAAIVFNARVKGQNLTFGTTGKLRNSDLIMYDRQSNSWWQQFLGEAIVGSRTGQLLKMLPARLDSFERARQAYPNALVLVANDPNMRAYGKNPYVGYDTAKTPFLYGGDLPKGIAPMMRVVIVDGRAWTLPLLKKRGHIEWKDVVLTWTSGQSSVLDTRSISKGRNVGNVVVQRRTDTGLVDVVHHTTFAFVFYAFYPTGILLGEGVSIR